ncbi:alpha-1 6-mannosyltransferase subunit [Fusarium beomiforme]|uniref:Alpha-1 6-mannosyltransferase subunit n=1 Tax=Fusarium beomiforme TaxID=44412 RepID=A0A9P5AKX3_9HYPO|nr:alpha-1 6-mannosyltransferase subunit [Fusarium beomiforme]
MDSDQIMERGSKRRRIDKDEEQAQGKDSQYPTSWSRSTFELLELPEATAQRHYERAPCGNVQTIWNDNSGYATTVDNAINYHMSNLDSYSYLCQSQNAVGIAPTNSYPNDITLQWRSSSYTLPYCHEPSQTHAPMFAPSYWERPLSGTQIGQPTSTFQHWPESSVKDTLPQPLPYHSNPSQDLTVNSGSSSALPGPDEGVDVIVCFGMIPSISARCDQRGTAQSLPPSFPVELEGSTCFSAKDLSNVSGQIMSEYGQMIQALLDESSLELHVSCVLNSSQSVDAQKPPRGFSTISCNLEISVYGPLEHFDELGTWFEDYQIYLQDSRECHREVRYCNPHRLSTDDISACPLLSDMISQSSKSLQLEVIAQQPDVLDELSSHEDLDETPQPSVIKRELRSHQKQALTFMLRREQGWAFFDQRPDIWEVKDTDQGRFFLNRVSDAFQQEEPPQCYGGIVADPMGLGKTLTMIALAATDLDNECSHMESGEDLHPEVPTTLIVVPPPSHLIRNGNSRMSQAVCALESRSRWAVTGTPIQNRLGDLATLFKFIKAHPYTDRRCFDADISRLWKSGEYQEAIKRLKRLSKCLLLRRDKGTVSLPPKQDLQCPVDFNPEERALYNKLRQKAIVSIDEALERDTDSVKSGTYVNVLQQIESLRLVCNLGLHYHTRHGKVIQNIQEVDEWAKIAQDTFNMQREMGPMVCLLCSSASDVTETFLEDHTSTPKNPLFFSCLSFICAECAQKPRQNVGCGHNPRCTMAQISTSGQALETSLPNMQPRTDVGLPSKVEALITDIGNLPSDEKCIVFSTWRMTLDIVEAGLEQSSIPSVRFDGKVPQKDRQNLVDKFRNDPSIRVMLLTLSCGAAGPRNPTLEEQALARIHRIGQTRKVTTIRFFVRNSFEEQVMKVQESKKYLAGLCLSPHDNGRARIIITNLTTPRQKEDLSGKIDWASRLRRKPLPFSRLDWAIAGTTVSTKIPDPEGNLTSHSTFHQWISSRTLDSDAGFMYPQPDSLTLEKGSMVNPETGINTPYEELWHDATPTAVPGEPAVRALVLQTENEEKGVRGSVVRLGCYAQGLIRVGEGISLERWEWKEGWKRTIRMGDAELPIEKILGEEALKEGDLIDVGGREWKVIEASGKGE